MLDVGFISVGITYFGFYNEIRCEDTAVQKDCKEVPENEKSFFESWLHQHSDDACVLQYLPGKKQQYTEKDTGALGGRERGY